MNTQAYELLGRALQASERGQIDEAEQLLKRALELDPEDIQLLRQAARFYGSVAHNRDKARHYALLCRDQVERIAHEMDEILGQHRASSKRPASRHIGGIIGPY